MRKYRNVKTEIDGIKFDSKKEASRYAQLKLLEKSGEISHLKLQKSYEIAPSVILDGKKKAARKYIADFVYLDKNKQLVVEDVKGVKTEVYRLKRHLMASVYGIEVVEV